MKTKQISRLEAVRRLSSIGNAKVDAWGNLSFQMPNIRVLIFCGGRRKNPRSSRVIGLAGSSINSVVACAKQVAALIPVSMYFEKVNCGILGQIKDGHVANWKA